MRISLGHSEGDWLIKIEKQRSLEVLSIEKNLQEFVCSFQDPTCNKILQETATFLQLFNWAKLER